MNKTATIIIMLLAGLWVVVFIALMWVAIHPGPAYRYEIRSGNLYYNADSYQEKDGCITFEKNKICGTYIIKENR